MRQVLLAVAIALTACAQQPVAPGPPTSPTAASDGVRPTAAGPPDVKPITCVTHYRANVTKSPRPGPVLTFTGEDQTERARFDELTFGGVHVNTPYDGRSLVVSVVEPGREQPLFKQLYQMEENKAPRNIFGTTGQGFTGLIYAYSSKGAELQFICKSG